MSKLFTPEEFKVLDQVIINDLIERNINFVVAKRIDLGKGFSWCFFRETIIKRKDLRDEVLKLTNKEKAFIKFLIDAKGELVSYEDIVSKVWNGRATIFTVRNFIHTIRIKTYYEIINTNSNRGYSIQIKN